MKLDKQKVIELALNLGKLHSKELVATFGVSRQYANILISALVAENALLKIGSTRNAFYVLPSYAQKHKEILQTKYQAKFKNQNLEEHTVLVKIEEAFGAMRNIPENLKSIFTYAFSEMFNNAIEHSGSKNISIDVEIKDGKLVFEIKDAGIGVFRNVMQKRNLVSELEAIQDILKGKTTTMPKSHSGEGIFFTSKISDKFILESFGYKLIVDNTKKDVFIETPKNTQKGTRVIFEIYAKSKKHLGDVFKEFTDLNDGSDFGFDKTEILVKLYTLGGIHISRSQARRILTGLDKFKTITFDFDKVPTVGQAFADEIFRVFAQSHPQIKLETSNMSEGVEFMVKRAQNEARRNF